MAVNKNKKIGYSIVEQTEGLRSFWKNARKYKPLTLEEEKSLFAEIKTADKRRKGEIVERIVMGNQRILYSTATTFTQDPIKVLDYINEGNIGLLTAIERYNLSYGVRFYTFAADYVYREMFEFNSRCGSIIRRSNDKKIGFRIKAVKDEFFTKNQRDPSNDELREIFKEKFNIDVNDDVDLYDVNVTSIDLDASEDGDDSAAEVGEFAINTASSNGFIENENHEYTEHLISALLSKLSDRERDIVTMAYGIDRDYPMDPDDIAAYFNITRTRVNQILASSLKKMKELTFNTQLKLK